MKAIIFCCSGRKKKPLAHLSLTHSVPPTGTFILSVARENAATLEKKKFPFCVFFADCRNFYPRPEGDAEVAQRKIWKIRHGTINHGVKVLGSGEDADVCN